MNAELRTSYDDFPYASQPLRQTHPDHLATVASLFGFDAAAVERCRVLEIGCASGGNLIPLAASYPDSTFLGIDLSPVQIGQGTAEIQALGLRNIRLLPMDVMAFDETGQPFDYVIAHGISERAARRLGAAGPGERDLLASDIMRLHLAGVAELHRAPPPFVLVAGARPEAGALARRDAARGAASANLRHEPVMLQEDERALLPLLDGSRTRAEVAALRWPSLPDADRLARLESALASLGRRALLMG